MNSSAPVRISLPLRMPSSADSTSVLRPSNGQQDVRAGTGPGIAHAGEVLAQLYDVPLNEFDRRGICVGPQNGQHAADTAFQIGIRHEGRFGIGGLGDELQDALGDDAERSFGTDKQVFQRKTAGILYVFPAGRHYGAVRKDDLKTAHIIAGDAVLDRTHTACVRADISADCGGLLAGVGRIKESLVLYATLQILQQDPRLDRNGHRVAVKLEQLIHQGKIEDDAAVHRYGRTDEIRSCAARRYGYTATMSRLQDAADFLGALDEHQRGGFSLQTAEHIAEIFFIDAFGNDTAAVRYDFLEPFHTVSPFSGGSAYSASQAGDKKSPCYFHRKAAWSQSEQKVSATFL